ncbi:MAG: glycosyltransferase family 2 protein [Pirellulaceae bacterium]|nr:glycosyltransferase family 2 protein [Pirellulaceae bacterium]
MSDKLTVLIPCRNESHNIRQCVESVRQVADEILVADSLSTDDTTDLVRGLGGCRLIEREFVDHADFKNWAIPQASHPWILQIDADERLTGRLAAEIREVLDRGDPERDGYAVRFDNYFLGRRIRHCGWNRSTVIRLFRREAGRYGPSRVHERLEIDPSRVGNLAGRIEHHTCRSLDQWTEKQNRYTTFWAEDRHAVGRRAGLAGILFRPPLRFLQLYLFRGGFLDGTAGLIVCLSSMYYTFLKYAKLWQLSRESNVNPRTNGQHRHQ